MKSNLLKLKLVILSLVLLYSTNTYSQLYTRVLVSDSGANNNIGQGSTSRNIAVAPNGVIGVVFIGSSGLRFAKSNNRGASFLPSIQLSTATSGECEINLAANGNFYIVHSNKIYISTDGGETFTSNTTATGSTPHVTSFGDDVYINFSGNGKVYRNSNNGSGNFLNTTLFSSNAFSDIFVDDATGNVFVAADNPTISLYKSTTAADTFASIPFSPSRSVYYSSYVTSVGSLGSYLFAAGGSIGSNVTSLGIKVDMTTGVSSLMTYSTNPGSTSRTLAADDLGDLVDGYSINSTKVAFKVSKNLGTSFESTEYIIDSASSHNVAINTFTQDVVVAYTGTNGQVYINVFPTLLLPRTVILPKVTTYGTIDTFKTCIGSNSIIKNFAIKGDDLKQKLVIKAPSGFQVSLNSSSGFDSIININQTAGKVDSTIIYVRMNTANTGTISGRIACSSIGALTQYIAVNGTVNTLPTITTSAIADIYSNATSFTIPYTATTENPNSFSIAVGSPNPMPGLTAVTNASLPASPILITVPASAVNTYNFNLTVKNSNTGCSSSNVGVTLVVIPAPASAPTVSTTKATLIGITNATLSGNVSDSGTATVTERGVVYATTINPTTANTKVIIGSGLGTFSQNVTGLLAAATYHVRAYAINSVGTSYGADSTFTTLPAPTVANVITSNVTAISNTSATLAGNVVSDGNATVTERGIVLATSVNPTTSNTKVTIGSGLGNFSQNITALTPNTVYHYRAYAINNVGTGYGIDSVFTTLPNPEFNKNITNAFSPDGNGTNDTWVIDNADMLDGHEITIYNIFGQVIFSQTGYNTPWDGKKDGNLVPSGEYYYQIKGSKVNIKGALLIKTHQ
ncbi:MAG: gliding motility-associated C-terminal domain-containing protein [Candidatus Methylacidiphilales bacterium]